MLLAPAIMVIKETEPKIVSALTIKQIMMEYKDGFAANDDPDEVVRKLDETITETFIKDEEKNKIEVIWGELVNFGSELALSSVKKPENVD